MPPILCLLYYFGLPLPDKIFSGGSAIDSFHFSTFNPILLRIPTLDFLQPQWQVSNFLAVSLECAQPQAMAFSIVSKLPC